jgi:hypothetical protein
LAHATNIANLTMRVEQEKEKSPRKTNNTSVSSKIDSAKESSVQPTVKISQEEIEIKTIINDSDKPLKRKRINAGMVRYIFHSFFH